MNNLKEYIIEKFKISKDIANKESNPDDPTTWQVGDILVTSGGYNMILVDFFEIVSKTAKSFKLKKLKNKTISGNGWQGECVPDEGHYDTKEGEITCRINKYGSVRIGGHYGHTAYLWDGKPQHYDHMD